MHGKSALFDLPPHVLIEERHLGRMDAEGNLPCFTGHKRHPAEPRQFHHGSCNGCVLVCQIQLDDLRSFSVSRIGEQK